MIASPRFACRSGGISVRAMYRKSIVFLNRVRSVTSRRSQLQCAGTVSVGLRIPASKSILSIIFLIQHHSAVWESEYMMYVSCTNSSCDYYSVERGLPAITKTSPERSSRAVGATSLSTPPIRNMASQPMLRLTSG